MLNAKKPILTMMYITSHITLCPIQSRLAIQYFVTQGYSLFAVAKLV